MKLRLVEDWHGDSEDKPPPNFQEIDEQEFAKSSLFTRTTLNRPNALEFIQVLVSKEYVDIAFFWMDDGTCFGISGDWHKGKVRYFKGALCIHEYRELSQDECRKEGLYHAGKSYHVERCLNCKRIESSDSSD